MKTNQKSKRSGKGSRPKAGKRSAGGALLSRLKRTKLKDKAIFEVPHYPQSEEFTSSAACAMMVLKFVNPGFKLKKENEYSIWQEAVNGSVWHGSKYGVAYALAKRGAKVGIISNTKDEGYDRKMAVFENVNLDTLTASFNEIKGKAEALEVEEEHNNISIQTIKKALSANYVPIVLINANVINSYLEPSPHWVVVRGYDKDAFYINDPYSDNTITMDPDAFKAAIGFEDDHHMILADIRHFQPSREK